VSTISVWYRYGHWNAQVAETENARQYSNLHCTTAMSYLVPSANGGFVAAVPGNASTFSNNLAALSGAVNMNNGAALAAAGYGVGAGAAAAAAPVQLTPFAASGGSLLNSTFTVAPSVMPATPRVATLFDALAQRQLTYGPYSDAAARPYPVTPQMFQPTLESPLLVRDGAASAAAAAAASAAAAQQQMYGPAAVPLTAVGNALLQQGIGINGVVPPTYFASAWSGGGRAGDRRPGAWSAAPYGYGYGSGYGYGYGYGCSRVGCGGFP
jgi:hypothetical protein